MSFFSSQPFINEIPLPYFQPEKNGDPQKWTMGFPLSDSSPDIIFREPSVGLRFGRFVNAREAQTEAERNAQETKRPLSSSRQVCRDLFPTTI